MERSWWAERLLEEYLMSHLAPHRPRAGRSATRGAGSLALGDDWSSFADAQDRAAGSLVGSVTSDETAARRVGRAPGGA